MILSNFFTALHNPEFPEAYSGFGCIHFVQEQYDTALADFKTAQGLKPDSEFNMAALAVTHHALGQVEEAAHLWKQLVERDANYQDANWVKEKLTLAEPMVEEARKLIARL